MGPKSSGEGWISAWSMDACMEQPLSAQEKAIRDRFVEEYLVDYQPLNAARRVGFSPGFAKHYAQQFMEEPYVRQRIKAYEQRSDVDQDQLLEYNRKRVTAQLFKEAHDPFSTGAARVAALSKLMVLLKMDGNDEDAPEDGSQRGGVMRVPAIASMDEWEASAMASQKKLAESAREDVH